MHGKKYIKLWFLLLSLFCSCTGDEISNVAVKRTTPLGMGMSWNFIHKKIPPKQRVNVYQAWGHGVHIQRQENRWTPSELSVLYASQFRTLRDCLVGNTTSLTPSAGLSTFILSNNTGNVLQWNNEMRSRNHCYCGKEIRIKYYECVCIPVLFTRHAKRTRRIILSSVACLFYQIFPRYPVHENHLLHIKSVLWFSLRTFFWKISHSKRILKNYHKCTKLFI